MDLKNEGERVDINYHSVKYDALDMYQKSHYKRYEFAKSMVKSNDIIGDMACGSGYGSVMLSQIAKEVYGYDLDSLTINEIKNRYKLQSNVFFQEINLLNISEKNIFDKIFSFETIEHFELEEIKKLFKVFNNALKANGSLVFSTPYNQKDSKISRRWHKTFYIKEETISSLLLNNFKLEKIYYQNYAHHDLAEQLSKKDFMIVVAKKI